VLVEPDALTGETDVQRDLAAELALETVHRHHRLAAGAHAATPEAGRRSLGVIVHCD